VGDHVGGCVWCMIRPPTATGADEGALLRTGEDGDLLR